MGLVYQIQNGLKKNVSESDICDAVMKNISPDLPLRSYLEGKPDTNIVSLSKILRSQFKEPNSITLFNALSNSRQAANESAQECVIPVDTRRRFNVSTTSYRR